MPSCYLRRRGQGRREHFGGRPGAARGGTDALAAASGGRVGNRYHWRVSGEDVLIMGQTDREEWTLLKVTLERYLQDPTERARVLLDTKVAFFDTAVRTNLEATMHNPSISYRDAALIQLAFALSNPGLDTTQRPPGARAMGGKLGSFMAANHIRSVADAYQNIGKNSTDLVRGNDAAFDALLTWMKHATSDQLGACFRYACAAVAATSRPVDPMPELNISKLTFTAVTSLYADVLGLPSQGAFQQYIVASILDALLAQYQTTGPTNYHVQTKKLNTTDKSSGAAGDVEIVTGNRVLDAYEVTADDWRKKIQGAVDKMKVHDLARIHIVAPVSPNENATVASELDGISEDISIVDLDGFVRAVVSALTKPFRNHALIRLYEYLERYQEDVERVNLYVRSLKARGLAIHVIEHSTEG